MGARPSDRLVALCFVAFIGVSGLFMGAIKTLGAAITSPQLRLCPTLSL